MDNKIRNASKRVRQGRMPYNKFKLSVINEMTRRMEEMKAKQDVEKSLLSEEPSIDEIIKHEQGESDYGDPADLGLDFNPYDAGDDKPEPHVHGDDCHHFIKHGEP